MSSNIFGYQGVNTPLESLTNGRYNVADYTTLRAQVESRLNALEKTQSDLENVTINGSLTVLASVTQPGYISAAGNGSFGGTLYSANNLGTAAGLSVTANALIGGNLQCNGNEIVNGDLTVGGEENLTGDLTVGGVVNVSASGIHFSDNTVQTTAATTPTSPSIYVNVLPYSQSTGAIITVPASSYKQTSILINNSVACTLYLTALTCEDSSAFPDGARYVTVVKSGTGSGFQIDIWQPGNGTANPYQIYYNQSAGSVYSMGSLIFSVNFLIVKYGSTRKCILISTNN